MQIMCESSLPARLLPKHQSLGPPTALLEDLADQVLLNNQRLLRRSHLHLVLELLCHPEYFFIVGHHDFEGLHEALCEDKVIGCEFEGTEEVRGYHRCQVVQRHLVVLTLLCYFEEELNNVDEDISIDGGEKCTDLFEFPRPLIHWGLRELAEPRIQRECAEWLTHVFQYLLQEIGYDMRILPELC